MPATTQSSGPEAHGSDAFTAGTGSADQQSRSPWWLRRRRHDSRGAEVKPGCECRNPFGELKKKAEEVVLDVRALPMEGQIGRTLALMEELPAGQRLRHINDLVPWPLFSMLDTRGYRYRLVGQKDGHVNILIWHLTQQPELEESTSPGSTG